MFYAAEPDDARGGRGREGPPAAEAALQPAVLPVPHATAGSLIARPRAAAPVFPRGFPAPEDVRRYRSLKSHLSVMDEVEDPSLLEGLRSSQNENACVMLRTSAVRCASAVSTSGRKQS